MDDAAIHRCTKYSPRNDKVGVVIASPLWAWRSTVIQQAKRQTRLHPPRHDGSPRRPYCPSRNDNPCNQSGEISL